MEFVTIVCENAIICKFYWIPIQSIASFLKNIINACRTKGLCIAVGIEIELNVCLANVTVQCIIRSYKSVEINIACYSMLHFYALNCCTKVLVFREGKVGEFCCTSILPGDTRALQR